MPYFSKYICIYNIKDQYTLIKQSLVGPKVQCTFLLLYITMVDVCIAQMDGCLFPLIVLIHQR